MIRVLALTLVCVGPAAQIAPQERTGAKPIPWIELNAPRTAVPSRPGVTRMQHVIEGLREWRQTTDIVIVTTRRPSIDAVYSELERRKPEGMFIIGGIKTAGLFEQGRFDDELGWKRIAESARRIAEWTQVNVIVLENESALESFHSGLARIDLDALARALIPLRETGLEIWWNMPQIVADTPRVEREQITAELVRAIARAAPRSRFLDATRGWAEDPRREQALQIEARMRELVGPQRMMPKALAHVEGGPYTGGKRFFSVDELWKDLGVREEPAVIVYTGETDFVSVGRELGDRAHPASRHKP